MVRNVVVVGASLAGLRAVETLRNDGFDGTITLVNAEAHLPYDRPPLSKRVLAGELEHHDIHLRKEPDYAPLDLDIRFGRLASALDPVAQTVTLDDGDVLPYDGVILATGATPRTIPGHPISTASTCSGPSTTRSRSEPSSTRHRAEWWSSGPASSVPRSQRPHRKRGLEVTILEALPVPLVRALGNHMGAACAAVHADHGVEVRTSTGVEAIEGTTRVERVRLSDGSTLDADRRGRRHRRGAEHEVARGIRARDPRRCRVRRDARRRSSRRVLRGRHHTLAEPPLRRGDARRALDERCRARRCSGEQPAARPRRTRCHTRRCRSSGQTSTTVASSSSAARTAKTK